MATDPEGLLVSLTMEFAGAGEATGLSLLSFELGVRSEGGVPPELGADCRAGFGADGESGVVDGVCAGLSLGITRGPTGTTPVSSTGP